MRGWTGNTTGSFSGHAGELADRSREQRPIGQRRAMQRDQQVATLRKAERAG